MRREYGLGWREVEALPVWERDMYYFGIRAILGLDREEDQPSGSVLDRTILTPSGVRE